MENKILKFSEGSLKKSFHDKNSLNNTNNTCLRGECIFRDFNGNILFRKDNLVVFRGRLFVLENLFKLDLNESIDESFIKNRDRKVCLFKIGSGGTAESDPWSPFVVNPLDNDLTNPVPFRSVVPSLGEYLTDFEKTCYYGEDIITGPEGEQYDYYLKRFNISKTEFEPEWTVVPETNTIAIKNILDIDKYDCRDQKINELGLFMAKSTIVDGVESFSEIEMVSRITFNTESFTGTKSISIEYLIHA